MKIGIHAHICDLDTQEIASVLTPLFQTLGQGLEGEYGGSIEHLWMDLELLEYTARMDGRPRHPFRFQKRVSGRSHFGLPAGPDNFNVGHFSVRPDFALLLSLPVERMINYVLQLIYQASAVLLDKQKKLGGFDAVLFRERFAAECQRLGHPLALDLAAVETTS